MSKRKVGAGYCIDQEEGKKKEKSENPDKHGNIDFTLYVGTDLKRLQISAPGSLALVKALTNVQDNKASIKEQAMVRNFLLEHAADEYRGDDDHSDDSKGDDDEADCNRQLVFTLGPNLENPRDFGDVVDPTTFEGLSKPVSVRDITNAMGYTEPVECIQNDPRVPYNRVLCVVLQDTYNSQMVTIPPGWITVDTFDYISKFMSTHICKDTQLYDSISGKPSKCGDNEVSKFLAVQQFIHSLLPLKCYITSVY